VIALLGRHEMPTDGAGRRSCQELVKNTAWAEKIPIKFVRVSVSSYGSWARRDAALRQRERLRVVTSSNVTWAREVRDHIQWSYMDPKARRLVVGHVLLGEVA